MQPTKGEITKKGRNRIELAIANNSQKTINAAIERKGGNKAENKRCSTPAEEVDPKTTARKVSTAAKPKRQRSTQKNKPKIVPNIPPKITKNNKRTQPKRERP